MTATASLETLKAELAALEMALKAAKKARKSYTAWGNEGGEGYNPGDAKVETALNAVIVKKNEIFAAEWTQVETQARKAAWNAAVSRILAGRPTFGPQDLKAIEAAVGFSATDMKRAADMWRGKLCLLKGHVKTHHLVKKPLDLGFRGALFAKCNPRAHGHRLAEISKHPHGGIGAPNAGIRKGIPQAIRQHHLGAVAVDDNRTFAYMP